MIRGAGLAAFEWDYDGVLHGNCRPDVRTLRRRGITAARQRGRFWHSMRAGAMIVAEWAREIGVPDRRLAAVMVTDVVGFTALMSADQDHALDVLQRAHRLVKPLVARRGGEWLEDAGDRSLSAFPSALDAVRCALDVQAALENEADIGLRIGVDVGEILQSGDHVYGDTINVVSFIEQLADPDGLVITGAVRDAIQGRIELNMIDLGDKALTKVDHSVRLFALTGVAPASRVRSLIARLVARRVPHYVGAYLAASWAVIEVADWLAENGLFDRQWVHGLLAALLSLLPAVLLLSYTHGAHGRDRPSRVEKIAVPLNLGLAALLFFALPGRIEPPERYTPIEKASVAVLPFVSLSDDGDNDYFGLGLAEELINALAKVPGLYVASRTSSFVFGDRPGDPRDIARKLRVATILEGSIRRDGNQVRVSAQLIDGDNNYHLWSEIYGREIADVFVIQEDIARSVATELVGVLQPDVANVLAEGQAASLEAFDLYLRGLGHLRRAVTPDSLDSARTLFRRALENDAEYAQAYAALCEVSLEQYVLERSPARIDEAQSFCKRALSLDDGLREVRQALGTLNRYTGRFEESAALFRQLLAQQPNARAWVGLGFTYDAQGNFAAAEEAFRQAVDLEPGNWQNRFAYAEFLYWQGRHAEALPVLQRVLDLSPDNARAYLLIGACHDYLGDMDASLEATQKAIEIAPTRAAYRDLGLAHVSLGDFERATDALERAVELGPDDHASWGDLGLAYLEIDGREAQARSALERARLLAASLLARNPRDWVTMAKLGLYTVVSGLTEEGVQIMQTAVAEGSEFSDVHYLDAVVHAHLGEEQQALDALEIAIDLGSPVRMIAAEPRFSALKNNKRWIDITNEQ